MRVKSAERLKKTDGLHRRRQMPPVRELVRKMKKSLDNKRYIRYNECR